MFFSNWQKKRHINWKICWENQLWCCMMDFYVLQQVKKSGRTWFIKREYRVIPFPLDFVKRCWSENIVIVIFWISDLWISDPKTWNGQKSMSHLVTFFFFFWQFFKTPTFETVQADQVSTFSLVTPDNGVRNDATAKKTNVIADLYK